MKKRKLIIVTIIALYTLSAKVNAQNDTIGIRFDRQLKWDDILAKAKTEHKYIFVDCYATWCGPCKLMEQAVYPQKEVGDIYNRDFISVKVQMDKTAADDEHTKVWYNTAANLEKAYAVNAYPTFLFFDPDGNPVHKVAGGLNVKKFIELAADAQNPDKQYYAVLKNFQPGKLDTADEKGLPLAFAYSDEKLAAKIATDYLSRIPQNLLSTYDSGRLMWMFQDDPHVTDIAVKYIGSFGKSSFAKKENADFIAGLSKQQKVMKLAVNYIKGLPAREKGQPDNLSFMSRFWQDKDVQQIARKYIGQLPEKGMCNKPFIMFLARFTQTTQDKGFKLFYNHTAQVDTVTKVPTFAQSWIQKWISNTKWQPAMETGKKTGVPPDFDQIATTITRKYGALYASKIIIDARVDWYSYLANDKKQEAYWPQLIRAEIKRETFLKDSAAIFSNVIFINNTCMDIYRHINDSNLLSLADNWMARITDKTKDDPMNFAILDTYALVLYKSDQTDKAIKVEEQAIKELDPSKHPVTAAAYNAKIEAMRRGEKIWLEKAYQN